MSPETEDSSGKEDSPVIHCKYTKRNMAGILSYEPPFDHKITGYKFSVEDTYRLLADFEMKTTTKFSCFKADKSFGNVSVTSVNPLTAQ